ncbi:MAG TPA: DUF512 domain-containing protein, partial [bacterium]|nr:DUF512 domain-containing protein [bacterium]
FLQARRTVPPAKYYEDFWQMENGVGLVRHFLNALKQARRHFPGRIPPRRLAVITGVLAAPVLRKNLLPACRRIRGLEIRIVPVKNRFFGETVTVSGLLTAGDIGREAAALPDGWELMIPDHCLNDDGLFLDGETLHTLERFAGRPVHAVDVPWRLWGNE